MMRMTNGFSGLALAVLISTPFLQAQGGTMAKPMAKENSYTGCVTAGAMAGSFTLTHATEEMAGAMGKDSMSKGTMGKDAMGKNAMGQTLSIASTAVDLSKHVGHQVSVTVAEGAMAKPDAMAKPSAMAAPAAVMSVSSLRMIAAKCEM